jgi:L-ascorbate metabolism protein UlaG (beta-lactamase superfamily)
VNVRATYIGGPTTIIEVDGLRFLTDPTFDPAGTTYETSVYTLRKTMGPALAPEVLGEIDAVLLSHDHHFDNLDRAGRAMLSTTGRVVTTRAGAQRLGGNAVGVAPWETTTLGTGDTGPVRLTSTPARHGPPTGDRGPVSGFLITDDESSGAPAAYVSGDTVWYEGMEEVAERADVRVAFLFMGAARVREVGPAHLTLTAAEGVLAARAMPKARIVPLHYEGWEHFSEGRADIERAFADAQLTDRLCWLPRGESVSVGLP